MIRKSGLVLSLILLLTVFVNADVPPPKGYVDVRLNFVAETKGDLSGYRFFFNFYGNLHEITLKNKGKTIVPPIGGGARYASGKFLAVPKSKTPDLEGNPTREDLQKLSDSIRENKIEGVIELGEHSFSKTVLQKDSKKVQPAIYLIERKADSLKMSQKKATVKKASLENFEPNETKTMIAGLFLSLSIVFGGVFILRKKS